MRQLSHPWQHVEGSAGAPRGTGTAPGTACLAQPAAGARTALRGTRMHCRPRQGAAGPLPAPTRTSDPWKREPRPMPGARGNVWSSCTQNAHLVFDTGEGDMGGRGEQSQREGREDNIRGEKERRKTSY